MEQVQHGLAAVGIYAALNFFILVWLSNAIGILRRGHKIAIGSGGNAHLERTMRGHANAAENMPIFLIGLTIAALIGMPAFAVHLFGISFTIGRAIHAHHFIQEKAPLMTRFIGYGIAFLATAMLFVGLLAHGLWMML